MNCLYWLLLSIFAASASPPALRVVKTAQPGASVLRNGGFEEWRGSEVVEWRAWQKGFRVAAGEGRGGSRAIVCERREGDGEFGASQTLALNRTAVAPLVVRGWSKAENVSGSPDSGYSIYVDIIYADNTPLWGQTGNFRCGTHDWEKREFLILPEKPVRTLTVHCLFRGHTGKVWFDDVAVEEVKAEGEAMLFQGVPVVRAATTVRAATVKEQNGGKPMIFATQDGLKLTMQGHTVTSLQVDGRELATDAPSGFLARDVAANSDVYGFVAQGGLAGTRRPYDATCPELGLKVQADFTAKRDHIVVQGRVSDTTGKDRAVTLLFALPMDATGWKWGDDIRRSRVIQGKGEFAHTVVVRCGATGTMSLYPLAAVYNDRTGIALAIDMAQPAQYRLTYHAGTRQLFIAYDFGLPSPQPLSRAAGEGLPKNNSPLPQRGRGVGGEGSPSSADFRFVIFRFDPRWGFRSAFQKLVRIFPDYFVVRSKEQGIWMPFTDISTVQGWQDFGFKYHEGNNNVTFDDANNILSFRYTEPMTWWMPMKKEVPRTEPEALRVRDEWAKGTNEYHRRMAQASRSAGMTDAEGKTYLLFRNEPWCDGAVWSLNPCPYLPGAFNAATVHWNDEIKQRLYGANAKGQLDGEYLDSLEGYVTADLNFRREHFRYTTVPLTFSSETKQPALFKGLAVFEFTKWICDDVHRLGKLTFANGVPYRFTFLCPWLDVMGTETNWLRGGQYQPAADATMSLWRTMCYQKPYLLLMNTNYDAFMPDLVEKYFQRSLFYGIFPSMFSHNASENPYWQNPHWYNRDRHLFKKYIPLIKRIAEAGWQPITEARCDNASIYLERFGPDANGAVYFTLLNDTAQPQSGEVTINAAALKLGGQLTMQELISGKTLAPTGARFHVTLPPQGVWLVRVE